MKKSLVFLLVFLFTSILVFSGNSIVSYAAGETITQTYSGGDGTIKIQVSDVIQDGIIRSQVGSNKYLSVDIDSDINEDMNFKWSIVQGKASFTSGNKNSDGSVSFKLEGKDKRYTNYSSSYVTVKFDNPGVVIVRLSSSKITMDIPVIVFPQQANYSSGVKIKSVEQTSFFKATVNIETNEKGYDGYVIFGRENGGMPKQFGLIEGNVKTQCEVDIPRWNAKYKFLSYGYISYKGKKLIYNTSPINEVDNYYWSKEITAADIGAKVKSVDIVGPNNLEIKWEKADGATSYDLYESKNGEFGKYVKKATIPSSKTCSYVTTVKKGVTYNYYVVIHFSNGYVSKNSNRLSGYISKEKLKMGYKDSTSITLNGKVYYYSTEKSKFAVEVVESGKSKKLAVYKIDDKMNLKKYKVVKLDKYDYWGGFCQGSDGKFYVVYGYSNAAEKKDKTVIKVVQFNSKWKRQKTANIKGSASNHFTGINTPFRAGTVSMAMKDNTLFIHTSRLMFKTSDGVNHQSNISFEVNTKTMKASNVSYNYSSHSFNQFARFKDNSLYLVDHGDAYPRSIAVTKVDKYKTDNQTTNVDTVFDFMGKTGDNYTGASIGGTEVGQHHILIAGASVPHKNKVKGVTGYGYSLKKNVFLITVDRVTGKKRFKWLTTYHPKRSNVTVGNVKLVKISDTRFAVLYSTQEKNKNTLHYLVVDDSGNVVYKKSYKDVLFTGSNQPLFAGGYIMWVERFYQTDEQFRSKLVCRTYRLPVIVNGAKTK